MIVEALRKVVERQDLSREEAVAVMAEIMSGGATDAQIAAFLAALRMKGETVEELTGFATVMREKVARVETKAQAALTGTDREALVDTCGTGGDASNTFNISTATAFVVAGAGLPVAKHGNRSVSGLCGSADVVEALGVDLQLPPEMVGQCIDEVGIGFLYAPLLHKAMKYVMPARREIKIRTVFNVLGPLTNPAGASAQVMGVYDGALTETLATVLRELGSRRAFVVHGFDGLDEISNTGETKVSEVRDGKVLTYVIKPEDLGIKRVSLSDLKGGDAEENASLIRRMLEGEGGPKREVVLMNAAAGIVAGGRAQELKEGLELAKDAIDNGAALEKLIRLQEFCARHRRSDAR
ncbi:MAG: anthranilate phosphoribosyltransferase [candidate division NC10 bacterium]|nr:anthranilate phosphoribosyltransferase [candidate division NC10 bacterium]